MAKLHMLKSFTDTISMSFVLEGDDGIFVVDGGDYTEADYMLEYLRMLGGRVRAWFLTHPHDDHVGCLISLLEGNDGIRVDEIYYNFPTEEFAVSHEPNQGSMTTAQLYKRFYDIIKNRCIKAVRVNKLDEYSFGNLTVRVLHTPNEKITEDVLNNSSVVFRFETKGKSLLFLGDLGIVGGRELLEQIPEELIRADYVQVSHHGQIGVERRVYEAIAPKYAMWCAPEWVWSNRAGKDAGYDTGEMTTPVVRGWLSELGTVRQNYLAFDTTQIIDL
ncbi:MAG: MBL fold metallo-hydrolase [Clostridia bacterium]|nr:MBL fold metallo-hydrolase [Clostridia bacterium]